MAMVVRTNNMAVNANRQLGMNTTNVSKSLEKLASGFRINRAGDDASGLAISEKMKAQIKGLETASSNSQDGISLIQTAEGALTEVHDMLNRMVELAGKSANGTMDDAVDRASLEKELNSLKSEINRISQSTNFNGTKLLDGSLDGAQKITAGAESELKILATFVNSAGAGNANLGVNSILHVEGTDAVATSFSIDFGNMSIGALGDTNADTIVLTIGSDTYTISADATMTAKDIASAFMGKITTTGLTGNAAGAATNIVGKMEVSDAGVLTWTQSVAPSSVSHVVSANSAVSLTITTTTGAISGTYNVATINNVQGAEAKETLLASTKFNYADLEIEDGKGFKIGNETYTFALGKDSKVDTSGANVIDLTDIEEDDLDGSDAANLQKKIAERITQATVDNATFTVGYNASAATFSLHEKVGQTAVDLTTEANFKAAVQITDVAVKEASQGTSLEMQIGDTAEKFNKVQVSIRDMSTKGLNIDDISVANQDDASEALTRLKNTTGDNEYGAINIVSSTRADLGALQNRLEHTINNLDVAAENMTAANSRIRDTDMAKQMMEYTKMNVLTQAAQAMLAQANSSTQSVLQLLQ